MGRGHRVIGGSKASWWEEQDVGNERGLRGIRGRIGGKMGVGVGTERGFRDRKGGSGEKGDVVARRERGTGEDVIGRSSDGSL